MRYVASGAASVAPLAIKWAQPHARFFLAWCLLRQLQISVAAVEKHVTRLLQKTATSNRTELVRVAITKRLLGNPE